MPGHTLTIGSVELVSLSDGGMGPSPLDVFPDSTMDIWKSEFPDLLDADGNIRLRLGSVAVRSSGKLIIVDTGMQFPDSSGTLLTDMADKGVDRDAVDLVVSTHLHPDHVGWNLTNGEPTFPNARYLVPKSDWDYWTQPDVLADAAHVQDQVLPLEKLNVMDLIEDDYKVTDELTTVATPGHTPGHISILIASGGERGFILGDVAHSPAQAHRTDWNPGFDIDGETSRKTRNSTLDQLEADGTIVASGHFPAPGFGRFVRNAGRRVWQGV
jgi:glyoxylase-like metal-dependent hydrolase (beta-lactamase superfamily II)